MAVQKETYDRARELLKRAGMPERIISRFGDDIVLDVLDGVSETLASYPDDQWAREFYQLSEVHMVCLRGEGWCDPEFAEGAEGDIVDEVCKPAEPAQS